ncbi:MAG: aldo/keto reductase [Candidatus Limnocylindrales bacterium]|jgi:aryl-alcohol dehydrogenase-like predicted oxidoreductase
MRLRTFGRLGWKVSEIGYGMWGMGGWSGSDDRQSMASLELAAARGVNFFDTAQAYGEGHSEQLLAMLLKGNSGKRIFAATKVPPMNRLWPSRRGVPLADVFPRAYVRRYVDISRSNLGVDTIDLLQLHVWEDDWLDSGELAQTVAELKREGWIRAFGISQNRWEPWNGIRAVRSGLVDAVQLIYNIFDQAPEDELFPACRQNQVAVIARVPFDEGSLTGSLTLKSTWPEGDWRGTYFVPENLKASVTHADALKPLLPAGVSMAELALRFILSNPDVSTVIPGMRKLANVEANIAASEAGPLSAELIARLRAHRWDRQPTGWSQ